MKNLNARQLRTQEPDPKVIERIKKNPIYIVLDNVLDTYNIGSIFRLADAVAAKKIFLCGETETPPNPRIKKASINTWNWVEWEYAETAKKAIEKISKEQGQGQPLQGKGSPCKIVAVEQHEKSIPLSELKVELPVVVVVGNETYGVSKDVLEIADRIVELPMFGINKSLNVMVSCGIVLYKLTEFITFKG
ncbi:hypothetical protein A2960_02995 [Candidatus Gottesmanbacteria bacterium RIFCSPLOWO2_01_FULL_39_12b]|uniref:tRNA/rRNA methyltransferase SpoU type domain-containing protein n=1 Tax=Candidatus Gottesmanbacteria bacterium RIFCSPLOWO2_01_FULL_39_12b TaxID=1798388 RepID=A0A1F6ARE6_9BACT|nr:MAG: hypothetical protein A2960_02995 [Candidatus Gottesmanbacteria bacterium RIFCSPLOWO2_01_FULL_39_12b]